MNYVILVLIFFSSITAVILKRKIPLWMNVVANGHIIVFLSMIYLTFFFPIWDSMNGTLKLRDYKIVKFLRVPTMIQEGDEQILLKNRDSNPKSIFPEMDRNMKSITEWKPSGILEKPSAIFGSEIYSFPPGSPWREYYSNRFEYYVLESPDARFLYIYKYD